VIDFRYHLVSIVAVFLALAIGIVIGSTELQGHTIDALNATSNSLRSQLHAANAARDGYQAQANASDQFLQSAEPKLLGGLLAGESLVIVTEPGAQGSVVDGVKQAAQTAGANFTGEVALQPKFFDISGATQSSLSVINSSIAGNDGTVFDAIANPQTGYQQQAAQLIASAILEQHPNQDSPSAQDAQSLLTEYAQDGYLNVSGTPTDRATLVVIVTPQTAPSDGANDPANQVLLAVAQEFATASAATLVAGSTTGSAQPGSAMSVLRSSSVASAVSSVDNADTTLGQISVMEALAVQIQGGKPNSYGVSGASAVSPAAPSPSVSPSISPSSSPTGTPTSHPKSTGSPKATATATGGKSVRNR
jgi:Copper transport outer membrane protein, MctB